MSIYDTLNDRQREAVFKTKGPVLILAGAGSGKTRVLTHRISYLIEHEGVKPWNILAITFTNKAAGEMRERVDDLIGHGAEQIWVSTFHSGCAKILRRDIEKLGYTRSFTIYDDDDQMSALKEILKKLNIDAFVVGDDWYGKYDYLKDLGVQVFYFPYGTGVSSSNLKKTIHDSYEANLKSQRQSKPESVKGFGEKE